MHLLSLCASLSLKDVHGTISRKPVAAQVPMEILTRHLLHQKTDGGETGKWLARESIGNPRILSMPLGPPGFAKADMSAAAKNQQERLFGWEIGVFLARSALANLSFCIQSRRTNCCHP